MLLPWCRRSLFIAAIRFASDSSGDAVLRSIANAAPAGRGFFSVSLDEVELNEGFENIQSVLDRGKQGGVLPSARR